MNAFKNRSLTFYTRLFFYVILPVSCIGAFAALIIHMDWEKITHRPIEWKYNNEFHNAIRGADRIVVRDGGFDCCGPVDKQKIIFEIKDQKEIESLYNHLQFDPNGYTDICLCCGYPGIDWYKGNSRLALTSIQHIGKLRWKGFKAGYKWPGKSNIGDAPLTYESAIWIKKWLMAHGIKEKNLK